MMVRLKQPWRDWSRGHVFTDMPGGQARTMIERGIAEEVKPEVEKQIKSPVDRMMRGGVAKVQCE